MDQTHGGAVQRVLACILAAAVLVACGPKRTQAERPPTGGSAPASVPDLFTSWPEAASPGDATPVAPPPNATPPASATTSTTTATRAPHAPIGPVRIHVSPARVLAGRSITVSYATAHGEEIAGRWIRTPVAEWQACTAAACEQTAWLRVGAGPVLLPGSAYDRAYVPYDDHLSGRPNGPDTFTVPTLTEGTFRVCTALTSAADGTEATACDTAAVLAVPPVVSPGDASGWFEVDPAHPVERTDTEIWILVHAPGCGGAAVLAREPEVVWGDAEVAVRVPVEHESCLQGPRPPPTPASVRLPGPIGERAVLDTWCMESMLAASGDCPSDGSAQRWPTPR